MYTYEHPRPSLTVDVAIFTIRDEQLNVLLVQRAHSPFQGRWALPGGFVEMDEPLEHAAARELEEETGVDNAYLEQLYTYGDPGATRAGGWSAWLISLCCPAIACTRGRRAATPPR